MLLLIFAIEGFIPFKRTCEGQAVRHPIPSFVLEDDSGSDVALSPPQDPLDQSLSGSVLKQKFFMLLNFT